MSCLHHFGPGPTRSRPCFLIRWNWERERERGDHFTGWETAAVNSHFTRDNWTRDHGRTTGFRQSHVSPSQKIHGGGSWPQKLFAPLSISTNIPFHPSKLRKCLCCCSIWPSPDFDHFTLWRKYPRKKRQIIRYFGNYTFDSKRTPLNKRISIHWSFWYTKKFLFWIFGSGFLNLDILLSCRYTKIQELVGTFKNSDIYIVWNLWGKKYTFI